MSIVIPAGQAKTVMLAAGACAPATIERFVPGLNNPWQAVGKLQQLATMVLPGEATYRAVCYQAKCTTPTPADLICLEGGDANTPVCCPVVKELADVCAIVDGAPTFVVPLVSIQPETGMVLSTAYVDIYGNPVSIESFPEECECGCVECPDDDVQRQAFAEKVSTEKVTAAKRG